MAVKKNKTSKKSPTTKKAVRRKAGASAKKASTRRKKTTARKAAVKGRVSKKTTSKKKSVPVKKEAAGARTKSVPAAKKPVARKKTAVKKAVSKKAPRKAVVKKTPVEKAAAGRKKPVVEKKSLSASAKSTVSAFRAALKKKQLAVARAASQVKKVESLRAEKIEKAQKLAEKRDAAKEKSGGELARPTGMYNGIFLIDEADINPFPKKTPYSRQELKRLKETLQKERDRLLLEIASLNGMSKDALESARENSGYSLHMAEHATDLQTAETNLAVRSYEEGRLEKVEDAIDRIENNVNHYGLCLASGRKIGIQRLIAQPHAHLCKEMQELYERIRSRRG
jgi:RNA polymerase-binding transcription factor DksA